MARIIELIIRYQVEIHKIQPSSIEQTFQFMDCVYMVPTEGEEIEVTSHEDWLMESYSYVYLSTMKKAMQILDVSPLNKVFCGSNLMVSVSRAMGH